MSCLNCLKCLEYNENGLGVQLADGGGLSFNNSGQLQADTDKIPVAVRECGVDEIDPVCDNSLRRSVNGTFYRELAPCARSLTYYKKEPDLSISNTPGQIECADFLIPLPANNTCYEINWMLSIKKSGYLKSDGFYNALIYFQFNGSTVVGNGSAFGADTNRISWYHSGTHMHDYTQPIGGAIDVPCKICVKNSGDNSISFEDPQIKVYGVGISGKLC